MITMPASQVNVYRLSVALLVTSTRLSVASFFKTLAQTGFFYMASFIILVSRQGGPFDENPGPDPVEERDSLSRVCRARAGRAPKPAAQPQPFDEYLQSNKRKFLSNQVNIPLVLLVTFWLCLLSTGVFSLTGLDSAIAGETAPATAGPSTQAADYLIGAGDVLEIIVWREPDISRTVRVRPDGKISLPLADDIQASQSTLLQLKERITEAVAAYVDHPSVYVMLQENRSKRFYIIGKVNAPGEYVLEKDITVLQAIAMVRGFSEWANKDDIIILRRGPQGQFRIEFDYDRVISGKDVKQNIFLNPDDVIIVP